jgi:hypothetical protein
MAPWRIKPSSCTLRALRLRAGGMTTAPTRANVDSRTSKEIGTHSFPNEGIKRSVLNAAIRGLLFGLSLALLFGLLFELLGWFSGLKDGLLFGLPLGLLFGLRFGGRTCPHYFALRLVLWHNNFAPLHYVRFLDSAATRIFLRKIGGGYVFVHRMLLEYFAARQETSAEQQNCNRNGYSGAYPY